MPVTDGEETRDVPPVVWRTGIRSTEPHLLIVGQPGSGTTTLMRSIALQALQHGDIVIIEGSGTGEYACLTGRHGVLAVECGLAGALATLEWAAHETERRLIAANRARQAGHPAARGHQAPAVDPAGPAQRPRPSRGRGRPADPQELLQVPLRHGRAANVTVVTADQFDSLDTLSETVRSTPGPGWCSALRTPDQVEAVLGRSRTPPRRRTSRPAADTRGSAPVRCCGSRCRPRRTLTTTRPSEAHRQAVLDLLPARQAAVEATVPMNRQRIRTRCPRRPP